MLGKIWKNSRFEVYLRSFGTKISDEFPGILRISEIYRNLREFSEVFRNFVEFLGIFRSF
jgi:hypothetical protein